ncbi:toll/interleukin-1 receptor domain-containing protein [Nodosilinea sp. LEGE 07298]|uniref:toll/interleukin-1 receptor domain-containing protein n=1 Tax=Nodosilinea sp. LEGE 07298 TaxID=2777970 RepID=UPI001881E736|nr:toll/interleukin-1 receptor domain-containing protein [Nodosilinea sp. LEGE 07298]MBE9109722.1 toll/interleukin-1 receptor domain-containing protein [Nodosilinea sp. LEGE 07298]
MPIIFLSYRRRDSQPITRKIHEHLEETYGKDAVFLDEKNIPKGEDIRKFIRDSISQCAVVLPIIDAEWLKSITATGLSGGDLNRSSDWFRIELEEALACRNVSVVPILIDGVVIPREDMLPESLQELPYFNGICVSSDAFHEDRPRLVREINRLITGGPLELPKTLAGLSDNELLLQDQYRHEVRYCLESSDGQIDAIGQIYLEALRQHLQLSRETTNRIREVAQQPYHRYTTAVRLLVDHHGHSAIAALQSSGQVPVITLDRQAMSHLRRLHHNLSLPRWKALKIEYQMIKEWEERYQNLPQQAAQR